MLRLQAEKKVFARQAVSDITPADAAARLVCMSEEGQVGRVSEGLRATLLHACLPLRETGAQEQQQSKPSSHKGQSSLQFSRRCSSRAGPAACQLSK